MILVAAQHQVSAVRSQSGRCCCIMGNLACAPSFLYSSVKHRASNQIPNYVRLSPTADPWDASSPPLWCLHNWRIDGALLSLLKASSSQDRLAMLARKRWAHHSSRSMGTKSAQKQKTENFSLTSGLFCSLIIHLVTSKVVQRRVCSYAEGVLL